MAQSAIPPYGGATVVITHRIRNNRHDAYEAWMETISPFCKAATGFLDWHIVRPIPGITATYTVIILFDSTANLRGWMESNDRKRLIKAVKPLLVGTDDFYISSGLDFWFVPGGARAKVPMRWKQFLITWSAIYPLVLFLPLVILPVLRTLGVPSYPPLNTLVLTAAIVFFMVYLIMPRYIRIVQSGSSRSSQSLTSIASFPQALRRRMESLNSSRCPLPTAGTWCPATASPPHPHTHDNP